MFSCFLKQIARGNGEASDLAPPEAQQLFAAMLDGGVPEFELGVALVALRMKGESASEMLGFNQALAERVHRLTPRQEKPRIVVMGTYEGARKQPNLTPLVALVLRRMGVPVLIHGALEGGEGRAASAYILRELGVLPCATLAQAQEQLDGEHLAFVPTAVLAPGLAALLALKTRMGVPNTAHLLVKLIDPFAGASVRLVGVPQPAAAALVREYFIASGERAIMLCGPEGEPFADPRQRPLIEYFDDGRAEALFSEEYPPRDAASAAPTAIEPRSTAAYIRKVLDGAAPLPMPIVNEIACCLYGAGMTEDLNQAKAIAAVELHSLGMA